MLCLNVDCIGKEKDSRVCRFITTTECESRASPNPLWFSSRLKEELDSNQSASLFVLYRVRSSSNIYAESVVSESVDFIKEKKKDSRERKTDKMS